MKNRVAIALGLIAGVLAAVVVGLILVVIRLDDNIGNQVANRTANVKTWCGAINQSRDYDRAFVASFHVRGVIYTLPDLPCKALEDKTAASAR